MSGSLRKKPAATLQPVFTTHATGTVTRSARKRLPPLSLRLSESERVELARLAGGKSLSGYIRERLFENSDSVRKPRTRKPPVKDHRLLARVLRALANADTVKVIVELNKACEDDLLVSDDLQVAILQACTDISIMRRDLVGALGLHNEVK